MDYECRYFWSERPKSLRELKRTRKEHPEHAEYYQGICNNLQAPLPPFTIQEAIG